MNLQDARQRLFKRYKIHLKEHLAQPPSHKHIQSPLAMTDELKRPTLCSPSPPNSPPAARCTFKLTVYNSTTDSNDVFDCHCPHGQLSYAVLMDLVRQEVELPLGWTQLAGGFLLGFIDGTFWLVTNEELDVFERQDVVSALLTVSEP